LVNASAKIGGARSRPMPVTRLTRDAGTIFSTDRRQDAAMHDVPGG
jgi:hypothetical protein